jgi:hypothetical protein
MSLKKSSKSSRFQVGKLNSLGSFLARFWAKEIGLKINSIMIKQGLCQKDF